MLQLVGLHVRHGVGSFVGRSGEAAMSCLTSALPQKISDQGK